MANIYVLFEIKTFLFYNLYVCGSVGIISVCVQLKIVKLFQQKLQAAAAQVVKVERESEYSFDHVSPLRLPKHLEETARADNAITAEVVQRLSAGEEGAANTKTDGDEHTPTSVTEVFKQVHFQESEEDQEDEEEDYDHDYEEYYNEVSFV